MWEKADCTQKDIYQEMTFEILDKIDDKTMKKLFNIFNEFDPSTIELAITLEGLAFDDNGKYSYSDEYYRWVLSTYLSIYMDRWINKLFGKTMSNYFECLSTYDIAEKTRNDFKAHQDGPLYKLFFKLDEYDGLDEDGNDARLRNSCKIILDIINHTLGISDQYNA